MSKSNFKGSLLATTIIAGLAIASPAFAQTQPAPDAPPPTMPPTNTQGTGAPAAPSDEFPAAGTQSSESVGIAEPTSADEIVVTGTLIRNPNLVASAPVTVVGQEELQLRQTNTAEEVLRTLPGQVAGIGSATNNGATGAATINLRGLGQQRSIALIDGVRLVPINLSSQFDLNNVPLALVDRIDVLTGGASSVYGADAVSGVVNFITRSDFAGMELNVADQITQRGDGNVIRADLTLGANFDDGRGNAVVNLSYQESDPVSQGFDRPASMVANSAFDRFFAAGSAAGTPSAIALPGVDFVQIDPSEPGNGFVPFYAPFNFNPFNLFQTPFQRYNMYAAGHYDVAPSITVYGRGIYSKNIINTAIAPSGAFGTSVTVNLSNPFLSPEQRQFLCDNTDFDPDTDGDQTLDAGECAAAGAALSPDDPGYQTSTFGLYRRTVEAGPRASLFTTNMFDFRAGVRGDITDSIGFDVFATHGESNRVGRQTGYLLTSRIRQSLLASNPTTCFDPADGCVPANFFGGPGTITPEQVAFIAEAAEVTTNVERSQARGTINGDVGFSSPWAAQPISFAIGGEYRKDSGITRGDLLSRQGVLAGSGGPVPTTEGGLDVYEGFAELIAPIASDRPFFDELQIEAGIRRSKYTVDAPGQPTFKTTTYKIAGSWAPVQDIKFRGNYNRAVRAPNIGELFAPQSTFLTGLVTDPCQGAGPLSNPALAAVCIAQGASPGAIGKIPPPNSAQANITAGGNPFLQPETATSYTVGAVLRPSFLPGFNATIDYYHIKIIDAITVPSAQSLVDACFVGLTAASVSDPACTGIIRNPLTGGLSGDATEVPGIFGALTNAGKLETSGVDVTANYRRNLGDLMNAPAKINLSFNGNYTETSTFQGFEGDVNRECSGIYGNGCLSGPALNLQPKYSFNVRPTLSLGRVDLSVLWRYIGKFKYDETQHQGDVDAAIAANVDEDGNPLPVDLDQIGEDGFQACPDFLGADPGQCIVDTRKIKAHNYFDFTTRFNVNEHFDMTFTVQNLFDKGPPSDFGTDLGPSSNASGNTFPNTYDAVGRRFGLGARIKF